MARNSAAWAAIALIATALASPALAAETAKPEKLWELEGLRLPESVLPDPSGQFFFVSNVDGDMVEKDGKGAISKVSRDGKMLEPDWVSGLNAPKGLGLIGDTLYVADIDELVAIDVKSAKVAKRFKAEGAKFLNDVATGKDGRVYVSDTMTNTIWLLENDAIIPFLQHERLNAPNGLLVDGDDRLLVASFGKFGKDGKPGEGGHLVAIDLTDKSIKDIGDGAPIGNLDGLAVLEPGSYLSTDWGKGPLYRISSSGKVETLVTFPPSTADFAYLPDSRTVVIPLSRDGKLVAYRIPE